MILARFVQSFGLGLFLIICPKFITEITPSAHLNVTGSYPILIGHIGCFLAILLGYLCIPYSGTEAEITSKGWQVVYASPLVLSFASLFMILFYFKWDSP